MKFTTQPLINIIQTISQELKTKDSVTFEVLNPSILHLYSGEEVEVEGARYIYRSYKNWIDLSQQLYCKFEIVSLDKHFVAIRYTKLSNDSFHNQKVSNITEKYGTNSKFAKIDKTNESGFLYYYIQALQNTHIDKKQNILNLGINKADEFQIIKELYPQSFANQNYTGIDFSSTAISQAKERFKDNSNVSFYTHDINDIDTLSLGKFDMLISIGTLQSSTINFKPFLMHLVQNYLTTDASIILAFPNSRWIDTQLIYGAKAPNYAMSEMSLVCNDIMFCKKYLQQKKYRVTITGKDYLFVCATKIGL